MLAQFLPWPAAWNGLARPVTCSGSVVVGAVADIVNLGLSERGCLVRGRAGGLPPTYVFMNTMYSPMYSVAAVILS